MAENKTKPTGVTPDEFLAGVTPERRRAEGERVLEIMREVTGEQGTMWGPSIVGFGERHYRYATGREGDWMRVGFSPRKAQMSLYGLKDFPNQEALLDQLGPHTTGAGCIYVKKLDEIDDATLRELIRLGYEVGDYSAE